jgi:hypothetical protein
MWGSDGTSRRRRIIRAEFAIGAIGCTLLGVFALARGSGWQFAIGIWLLGAGANYVPLALHAQSLSRPGALEGELHGLDIPHELRRAGLRQFWIAVPFAGAGAALAQARSERWR